MNLSIRNKLIISALITLAFVAVVGLIGAHAVGTLSQSMVAIKGNSDILRSQMDADQVHDALRGDVLAALLASGKGDQEQVKKAQRESNEHIERFRKRLAAVAADNTNTDVKQALEKVRPDADAYLNSVADIVQAAAGDAAAAQAKFDAFMVTFGKLETSMAALGDVIAKASEASETAGQQAMASAGPQILVVALLSMVISLTVGYFLARSIIRPIDELIVFADGISSGDLSTDLGSTGKDKTETGRLRHALASMRGSLHTIVSEVRIGTDAMATASSEIASGNLDLSSRTEQQASSLEETASSMEELTSTVRQNADNANQANLLAASASEVAIKGGQVVSRVVETMEAINASSKKIVDIIAVIDGIAFQTNILALNAAVEAARAGEQGRGFAVVATEVRNLAQRSAAAAREIKALIGDSVDKVDDGGRLVGEAGVTMDEIVQSIARVTDIMSEIASASAEQTSGIDQVNSAIGQMDQVTQQNAALVEEAAAAAGSLQEQAAKLADVVSVFKLDGYSGARNLAPARPVAAPANRRAGKALAIERQTDAWETF